MSSKSQLCSALRLSIRYCLVFSFVVFTHIATLIPLLAQGEQPGIVSPATGTAIGGDVLIRGTAVIDPFQKYELHYKLEPSGDDAYIYFGGDTIPVVNGQLGVWQAGGLAPGVYSLRLRVVKNDGNYAEYFAKNLSVNLSPTESPTPEEDSEPTPTPIPTATFTPAPQPTPVVGEVTQPELEAAAPPTPTNTPETVAIAPESGEANPAGVPAEGSEQIVVAPENVSAEVDAEGSLTRELGAALSLNRLRTHFFNGVRFSAALFLGVVALYAGKRLFDWAWTQFT